MRNELQGKVDLRLRIREFLDAAEAKEEITIGEIAAFVEGEVRLATEQHVTLLRKLGLFLMIVDSKRRSHWVSWTPETTAILEGMRAMVREAVLEDWGWRAGVAADLPTTTVDPTTTDRAHDEAQDARATGPGPGASDRGREDAT